MAPPPPPSMSLPLPLPPNRSPLHFPNSRRTRFSNLNNHHHDIVMPVRSSFRSLDSHRSLHQLLGAGLFADVILWRKRSITMRILIGVLASWLVFHVSGYTLLSFSSNVLLLLLSLLFLWAKAATILHRPLPPIPHMQISKDTIKEAVAVFHSRINMMLSGFNNIAQGKDSKLFYKVAICLVLISLVGRSTDIITLSYTSIVIILTVPALYEKYEDFFDTKLEMYEKLHTGNLRELCNKMKMQLIGKLKHQ